MLNRAYTLFDIKGIDQAQRIVEGYASTPTLDRMGDVLLSRGAEFTLPMPLLWQHQLDKPIGTVIEARPDDKGIRIKAQIASGVLPYIDEAWALIKAGLVRGFSVGWKPLDAPTRTKAGGMQYARWLWAETSAVTVPANATATIDLIKSLDVRVALSGTGTGVPTSLPVGGAHHKAQMMTPTPQPIAAQLDAATASLNTKMARLQELSLRDGTDNGLDPTETDERNTLTADVDTLTARVSSFRALEKAQAAMARPTYVGTTPTQTNQLVTQHTTNPVVEVKGPALPPGIELARYVQCKMAAMLSLSRGHVVSAIDLARKHYPDSPRIQWMLQKDNIPAATTTDSTFAGPLVEVSTVANEFVDYLRPRTVLGRIQGMTRVPFNSRVAGQTSGATGYWVGQGQAKPLTRFNLNTTSLGFTKVAAIIALTEELARFSSPSATEIIRRELTNALVALLDSDFLDPANAGTTAVKPRSITSGITPITNSGTTLANTKTGVASIMSQMIQANVPLSECVWLMPEYVALQLSLMSDSNGVLAFPGVNVTGGTFMGLPLITSQVLNFSHTPLNNVVLLLHAPSIALADDGGFTIDVSREASLEMDDQPVMSSSSIGATPGSPTGPTGSAMVSMFQTNSIAIRAERFINWARLRDAGVVWMEDVAWTA